MTKILRFLFGPSTLEGELEKGRPRPLAALDGAMTLATLLLWSQLAYSIRLVVDAFHASPATRRHVAASSRSVASLRLHGVSEWREKFSSSSSSSSSSTSAANSNPDGAMTPLTSSRRMDDGDDALPLLLLPFAPSQILLPGQSTTFKFRHGKYMDLIDESLTSYESVLGMSVLGEDGPLPYAVLCEVLGDELVVNAGYRGFSSMEVTIRAVGRAMRAMIESDGSGGGGGGGDGSTRFQVDPAYRGRTTISDDIHIGRYVEWQDAAMSGDEFEIASEYSRIIEGLMKPGEARGRSDPRGGRTDECHDPRDEKFRRRQVLFARAYDATLEHSTADLHPTTTTTIFSDSQRRLQAHLMAVSWASLSAFDDLPSPSIITRAIATKDTVERLRLGLAMMFESQIPHEENDAGETKTNHPNSERSDGQGSEFQ
ncbi:hypothetical protein ACHAXA_005673 [Cyclostephanos tholiformis]|uniref:Lon N-terminal domain-containing protein n=1 Tax=Cyclostephanos tholiformis TaxID=382380 RepID=A0ABD3SR34_9STRA